MWILPYTKSFIEAAGTFVFDILLYMDLGATFYEYRPLALFGFFRLLQYILPSFIYKF